MSTGIVFLYLGFYNAVYCGVSFFHLHPITLDLTSVLIIVYWISIFAWNGIYGAYLAYKNIFKKVDRCPKACFLTSMIIFLSFIFPMAPLHMVYQDFYLEKQRRKKNVTFSQLCNEPLTNKTARKKLLNAYKECKALETQWKKHQKMRASYLYWDLMLENLPQLILLTILAGSKEMKGVVDPPTFLVITLSWTWQRYSSHLCTIEGPVSLKGKALLFGRICMEIWFRFVALLHLFSPFYDFTPFGFAYMFSRLNYSPGLKEKYGDVFYFPRKAIEVSDMFYHSYVLISLAMLLINFIVDLALFGSKANWRDAFSDAFASLLFPSGIRDWAKPGDDHQRTTKSEIFEDWENFKYKHRHRVLLHLCENIVLTLPEWICLALIFVKAVIFPNFLEIWELFKALLLAGFFFVASYMQILTFDEFNCGFHPYALLLKNSETEPSSESQQDIYPSANHENTFLATFPGYDIFSYELENAVPQNIHRETIVTLSVEDGILSSSQNPIQV